MTGEERVLISKKHYQELLEAQRKLALLEAAGADNCSECDCIMEIHLEEDV